MRFLRDFLVRKNELDERGVLAAERIADFLGAPERAYVPPAKFSIRTFIKLKIEHDARYAIAFERIADVHALNSARTAKLEVRVLQLESKLRSLMSVSRRERSGYGNHLSK